MIKWIYLMGAVGAVCSSIILYKSNNRDGALWAAIAALWAAGAFCNAMAHDT